MPLADNQIKNLVETRGLIQDFFPTKTGLLGEKRVPSYGLSYCGYDFRLGETIVEFKKPKSKVRVDPVLFEQMGKQHTKTHSLKRGESFWLKPKSFILAHTIETFKMPEDLMGRVYDKSTLARCGIDLRETIIEPGWQGQITLEIKNDSYFHIELTVGMGVGQIIFERVDQKPNYSYKGKYQGQQGVTLAK
jgi:dCTP deaminase